MKIKKQNLLRPIKVNHHCLIKEINHGIACRIGNTIYYNKALKDYPQLLKAILKHEQTHSEGFNLRDIAMDIDNKELKGLKRQYYKFILKNPKSFTEMLPFGIYDGKFVLNPMILFLWIVLGSLTWLIVLLSKSL